MKKYIFYLQWLPFFLAFSLGMGSAYAEDNLAAFQQEVAYAKQKHEAILSNTNGSAMEKEAQNLLEELAKKGFSNELKDADKASEIKPAVEPEKKPAIESAKESEKKWRWVTNLKSVLIRDKPVKKVALKPMKGALKKEKEAEKSGEPGWFFRTLNYREKKPTDGELLYKVAVSDNKITLKEAVEIAEANSINLRALQKKIEVAKSKLLEAKRALYPTVQGVVTASGGLAGTVSSSDPHGRFYQGENRKVSVSQPIFYGGELRLTVKQAEANVKSSQCELKKAEGELVNQVKTAYYGAVKAEYNLQYQMDLYKEINDIHDKVTAAYKEKVVAEIDYLNTESEFHQVFFQVEGAKNDLASALLILLQVLDLASDKNFPIDLHLNFVKVHPDVDEVIDLAIQNNPEVRIKAYGYESAKYSLQVFQAKKYPRVDLRGAFGYLGENYRDSASFELGNNDIDPEKEWFVGLQSSMPLGPNSVEYSQTKHIYGPTVLALHGSEDWEHKVTFNLFDKLADITDEKSAQAALLQAQGDYEKAKNEVTLKIKDDFYNLQKALIQIDSTAAKMRYQDKQNGILRYMVGLQESQIQSLIEGLIEMAQDRYSFIQAVSDYHLAVSSLNQSIGDPDYLDSKPK